MARAHGITGRVARQAAKKLRRALALARGQA
jgi:hypothetical protein